MSQYFCEDKYGIDEHLDGETDYSKLLYSMQVDKIHSWLNETK